MFCQCSRYHSLHGKIAQYQGHIYRIVEIYKADRRRFHHTFTWLAEYRREEDNLLVIELLEPKKMKHEMQKPRSGCLALVLAALLGLCVFMTLAGITAPLLLSDMLFQKGSQMWKVAAVVVPMLCLFISIAVGCGAIRMMKRKSLFMLFFTVAWCGCISPEQNEFARYAPLDVCGIIGLSKGLIAHNRPDVDLNDLRLFCVQREYRDIATTFKHSRPIAEETLVVLFFLESSRREERATEHPDPFTIPSSNSDGTWNVSYTGVMITIDPWGNVSNSTVQILEDVSAGSYPKEKAAPIL